MEQFKDNGRGLLVPDHKLLAFGRYHGQIIRAGEVIDDFEDDNLVVNEGLNALLGVMLGGATQIASWYLGLFTGNYTPVATDAAAVIAANSTETNAYTSATRPQFVPAAPASQSITNSASQATFTFNATVTIYGAFLASSSTISGTTGTLFSAARFSSSKSVVSGDQLLLTYTFSAASA
ncbi:hypothetical protein [Silvimonas sp.]|uniref:hypothetical protein n=1 Tax=Silvimonas sp. TaxID=2650811 RepID=UPI002846210F|nr:hypothetical protein [Silvimonas sp.]MDR3427803.1 hypothetical protein [Silvimonas sp.]